MVALPLPIQSSAIVNPRALRAHYSYGVLKMHKPLTRNAIVCASAVIAATFALSALADEGGAVLSAQAEMDMMDADHDGRISEDEHAAGAKSMFGRMDANGDGTVTASEMDSAQHAMKSAGDASKDAMSSAEKIRVIDTNGDGVLSADEHEAGARNMFQKMDSDHDGALTVEEIASGHAAMLKKA
jgi:hypothetical protein